LAFLVLAVVSRFFFDRFLGSDNVAIVSDFFFDEPKFAASPRFSERYRPTEKSLADAFDGKRSTDASTLFT
jgi:hypothetical protein